MESLCKETVATNKALLKLQTASRALFILLLVALCLAVPICALTLVLLASGVVQEGSSLNAGFWVNISSSVVSYIAFLSVMACLAMVFRNISKGCFPFTKPLCRLVNVIGILFVVIFVADLIADPGFSALVQSSSGLQLGISNPPSLNETITIFIDAKAILAAVVSFCLSMAFSYGRMLQEVKDGTV